MSGIPKRTRSKYMRAFVSSARSNHGDVVFLGDSTLRDMKKEGNFESTVLCLEGLGLISVDRSVDHQRILRIRLTAEGYSYFERLSDERRHMIMNSILVPILVSIITTAISVYILPPLGRQVEAWLTGLPEPIPQSSSTPWPIGDPSENQ